MAAAKRKKTEHKLLKLGISKQNISLKLSPKTEKVMKGLKKNGKATKK